LVCHVLRKRPDPNNWSEYPNVWGEVEWHVHNCEWYKVYDIVEAIRADLATARPDDLGEPSVKALTFEYEINSALRELGGGWQLQEGVIMARGDDAFEAVVSQANEALEAAGYSSCCPPS
ncbi:MAG TPA: hypothetical protein VN688_26635, partial [Gemmataceae bacterium]|nr:hypothetical protein [Gemmataceae bacterium]